MVDQFLLYLAVFSCTFAALAYIYKIIRYQISDRAGAAIASSVLVDFGLITKDKMQNVIDKIYGKVEVNCWFCNGNTKVKYKLSNSFVCPFCDQYNGFREDGDYNCIIPAQHSESYNCTLQPKPQTSLSKDKSKFANGFCDSCNLNQALKIRALAEFSSFSSDDNDEIEKFRERLEEIYGLCQQCQAILHQTLGKQNSWLKPQLISWKLLQSKAKTIKALVGNTKSSRWKIFHILSLLICSILCLISLEKYSPDLLHPLRTSFELSFMKLDITNSLLIYLGLSFHSLLIIIFSNKLFTMSNLASYLGWCIVLTVENCGSFLNADDVKHVQCVANIFNLLFIAWLTRFIFSEPAPAYKAKTRSPTKRNVKRNLNFYTSSVDGDGSPDLSCFVPPKVQAEDISKKTLQKDLDADLLSLKISTPKKNSGTFSPQNLFRDNASEKGSSCRNVVQPSKFGKHFITQASWVAGGYWGSPGSPQRGRLTSQNVSHLDGEQPNPVFSASRSSSQSSGFVSQMSECTSSKSQQNGFQNGSKCSHSQHSSFLADSADRGSVYSWNRTPVNHASSFSTSGHQNLEPFEAHSACSASSFLSDNSQAALRVPSQHGFCYRDNTFSPPMSEILPLDTANRYPSLITKGYVTTSYLNLGIAFILGLSVSANIFLVIILSHYDITIK